MSNMSMLSARCFGIVGSPLALAACLLMACAPTGSSQGTGGTAPGSGGSTPGSGGSTTGSGGSTTGSGGSTTGTGGSTTGTGGGPATGGGPGSGGSGRGGATGGTGPGSGGRGGTIVVVGTGGAGMGGALPQDDPNLTYTASDFQIVTAPERLAGAMMIDVDNTERAFIALRKGEIKLWKPDGTMSTAGRLTVFSGNEDGLLGVVLDPQFATNHWIYLYYSAPNENFQRLSRFTVNGDTIDMASESIMLKVPDDRVSGVCHTGGGMEFDSKGNLFLAIGDGTDPYQSNGFSPMDERAGSEPRDAQRTSGNSKDFRGKIHRIKPTADGKYTIPAGNLFANAADGLPEIFVMGTRNSYRIAVDKTHDWVYWGDVGPDSGTASSTRGPRGYDEFNQAKVAGYYGWPFCIADNKAYNAFNFSTSASGALYDCAGGPTNNSRNNTGIKKLPPAQPAWIFYHPDAGGSPLDSADRGGRTAIGGSHYTWKMGGSKWKLPRGMDGHLFLMEFSRHWVREVVVDGTGRYVSNTKFLSSLKADWGAVLTMRISPGGVMYIAQYGGIDTYAGSSPDPQSLFRVEFVGKAGKQPVAVISSDVNSGALPLAVRFSSAGSSDPMNLPLTYEWDFNGDGTVDSTAAMPPVYTYTTAGLFKAKLTVRNNARDPSNNQFYSSSAVLDIIAGNTRPVVTITSPPAGGFVGTDELVDYAVSVTDAEDGTTPTAIACTGVATDLQLAHDEHVHPGIAQAGCTGSARTTAAIIPEENAWYQIAASYQDKGTPSLAGATAIALNSKRVEAEHYSIRGTVTNAAAMATNDPMGGNQQLGSINDGSSVCWNQMNFQGITSLSYRVLQATGGRIELHQDSATGTMLSTVDIPAGTAWTNVPATLTASTGTHKMCFVFRGASATARNLFSLNWIDFVGAGVSHP
jgi:cytochrome c